MSRSLPPPRVLSVLLLCCGAALGSAQAGGAEAQASGQYPFVFYGRALVADAPRLELRQVGTFSPATRAVAGDESGRIWGRLEPRHLGALDPATNRILTRVRLPRKPDLLLIRGEEAIVTHRASTPHGYTVSVMDLRRQTLVREISGLAGPAVELIEAGGLLYLVAAGVLREDPMHSHLYRIDTRSGRLQEAAASPDAGLLWSLAAAGDRLYLGYLPARDSAAVGRIEAHAAADFALLGSVEGFPGPLRALYAEPERVLAFCEVGDGDTQLLLLDPLLQARPLAAHSLQGPVARVLGIYRERLVYLDYPFEAGFTKVNLCFYDLQAGRELARIDIRAQLIAEGGE